MDISKHRVNISYNTIDYDLIFSIRKSPLITREVFSTIVDRSQYFAISVMYSSVDVLEYLTGIEDCKKVQWFYEHALSAIRICAPIPLVQVALSVLTSTERADRRMDDGLVAAVAKCGNRNALLLLLQNGGVTGISAYTIDKLLMCASADEMLIDLARCGRALDKCILSVSYVGLRLIVRRKLYELVEYIVDYDCPIEDGYVTDIVVEAIRADDFVLVEKMILHPVRGEEYVARLVRYSLTVDSLQPIQFLINLGIQYSLTINNIIRIVDANHSAEAVYNVIVNSTIGNDMKVDTLAAALDAGRIDIYDSILPLCDLSHQSNHLLRKLIKCAPSSTILATISMGLRVEGGGRTHLLRVIEYNRVDLVGIIFSICGTIPMPSNINKWITVRPSKEMKSMLLKYKEFWRT
jgi:hypothetical protein